MTNPIEEQEVVFGADGTDCPGYVAHPGAEQGLPGVVVIQEWWGMDEQIREVVRRLAHQGYLAIAPDLYRGQTAQSPDRAQRLYMKMHMDQAALDVLGAVRYLKSVGAEKCAVLGFCLGGQLSLITAASSPDIAAVVDFYGPISEPNEKLAGIQASVLLFHGGADAIVPSTETQDVEAALREMGISTELHIYPEADHAFFNENRPERYSPTAAADAWERTLDFLDRNLKAT